MAKKRSNSPAVLDEYFIYRWVGDDLIRVKNDPKGVFIRPISAYTALQAVSFYVKQILKFKGSDDETRAKIIKYRAVPTTLGASKHIETPIISPTISTAHRQKELFPGDLNAMKL